MKIISRQQILYVEYSCIKMFVNDDPEIFFNKENIPNYSTHRVELLLGVASQLL